MIAVEDEYSDKVVDIITKHANTGMFGDGKVFVCQLEEVWTIRTKKREVHHG
ncbi:MAG: P-II family nitrogen regulator [Aquificaceae bacterium]|nr:P-II family nitrogen regulator [Aquificaceae bacterium]